MGGGIRKGVCAPRDAFFVTLFLSNILFSFIRTSNFWAEAKCSSVFRVFQPRMLLKCSLLTNIIVSIWSAVVVFHSYKTDRKHKYALRN